MRHYQVLGLIDGVAVNYAFQQGEEEKMDNFIELMYQASKNRRIKFEHDIIITEYEDKELKR